MFKRIMVPVDLSHRDRLGRALDCAADLAAHYKSEIVYAGVTSSTPSKIAHNPEEYKGKLAEFAKEQARSHGIVAEGHAMVAHDPTTEMDDALMKAVDEVKADLVVMQSHIPGVVDYVWPSNGGKIAEHAKCSVFVVRG